MAEVNQHYNDKVERQAWVKEWEGKGYRMLYDTFDPDWKFGDELHGTMVFTTWQLPILPPPPKSELELKVDDLAIRVDKLEKARVM